MISEPIKQIIQGYLSNLDPTDIEVGEVVSVAPLMIKIPDFPEYLSSGFLIVPKRLVDDTYEIEISGLSLTHSLVDEGSVGHSSIATATIKLKGTALEVGDKVSMCKAQGGQKYLLVDKVVVI